MQKLISPIFIIYLLTQAVTSQAALIGRLPATPGGTDYQAYYDDELDITWATNTNAYGPWPYPYLLSDFTIGGISGWTLPSVDANGDNVIVDCTTASATDCKDNHFSYMFHVNGITSTTPGPFLNLISSDRAYHWSRNSTGVHGGLDYYAFNFYNGQLSSFRSASGNLLYAWAIHYGDVAALVPIPPAVWLFVSGLLGLIALCRSRKHI